MMLMQKHLPEGQYFHEYNVFQYKAVTTQIFTVSLLGYVLTIFIRTRGIML